MRIFAQKPKLPQQAAPAKTATIGRAGFGQNREVNSIFRLQPAFGKQGAQRLSEANEEESAARSAISKSTRLGHDFSRIRIHPTATESIQTKLDIKRPADAYEQEAERAADRVMNLALPEFTPVRISPASGIHPQRKCASCKEEEETVQRKEAGLGLGIVPPIVHEVLGSPGQPLDPVTRAFMEPRFAQDFGRVRIHTDQRAASSARAIDALAYTAGENIVFGSGQHRPDTSSGRHLLAHELAHVVQQAQQQPARMIYRKATKQDEADKVIAVRDHTEQQQRVVQYLSNALKIKPDPTKDPLDPDTLYHNTAELVDPPQTAKAVLKVLTPTHYSDPNSRMFYFDNRVPHPQIKGDYPADRAARDSGVVEPPSPGTQGQTDVLPSQNAVSSSTTTKKEEEVTGRVDPTYTGKESGMPEPEATQPAKAKTPSKPSTPPVIAWSPAEVKLFLGRSAVSEAEFKNTLVHEGQHVADWQYLKPTTSGDANAAFELYKSEFRAFWIQPPVPPACQNGVCLGTSASAGGAFPEAKPLGKQGTVTLGQGQDCDVCGGAATPGKGTASGPPSHATAMKNERQEAIFRYMVAQYPKDHFDCWYVCNKDFRDKVDAYDRPAGANVVNSARLIELNVELQKLTPSSTPAEIGQTNFQSAIEHLDAVDWKFLNDAKLSAPFWNSVKGFAPAPIYLALETLAKKGNPGAKDISQALEKALAKSKAP
jgi:hypothetical protein